MTTPRRPFFFASRSGAVAIFLGLAACGNRNASPTASASASGSAMAAPADSAASPPPKTGTVLGRVTIKGDPPEDVEVKTAPECNVAKGFYGKVFRVGADRGLADALVAVTNYPGDPVPARTPAKDVYIADCSFGTRTVVATVGQRIDVSNTDTKLSFMPYLDGAPFRAQLVAMPQGKAIQLRPGEAAHYLLRDLMQHPYMIADVFVLPYATADVTGADGRFKIEGVPVGKARIDAKLPVFEHVTTGKDIEVHEGDNVVDLELRHDKAADKVVPIPEAVWGDRH